MIFQQIFLGSDHRGFEQKEHLKTALTSKYSVVDCGPTTFDPADDYNDAAIRVAQAVLTAAAPSCGILLCGSAHGIAIQANRFRGIRAIVGYNSELARLGREHNNANILCLSADHTPVDQLEQIIETFLATDFSNQSRHIKRNQRLDQEFYND